MRVIFTCEGCAKRRFTGDCAGWLSASVCSEDCAKFVDSHERLSKPEGPDVFLDGKKLEDGTDYTSDDPKSGVVTFAPGALKYGTNRIKISRGDG